MVNVQEGKTKPLREWRFTSKDEIDKKKILEYIKEAIEVEKKVLKIQPEKFKPLPVPELLMNELKKDKNMKANFEKLTSGKQKEYIILHLRSLTGTNEAEPFEKNKTDDFERRGIK